MKKTFYNLSRIVFVFLTITTCFAMSAKAQAIVTVRAFEFNTSGDAEGWVGHTNNNVGTLVQATSINGVDGVLTCETALTLTDPQLICLNVNQELNTELYTSWNSLVVRFRQMKEVEGVKIATAYDYLGTQGVINGTNIYGLIGDPLNNKWTLVQETEGEWIVATASIIGLGSTKINLLRVDPAGTPSSNGKFFEVDYVRITAIEKEIPTSVQNLELKEAVALKAYPNPFVEETTISYVLNSKSNVKLSIYNTSGQMVSVINNQEQPAGAYTYKWDGLGLDGSKLTKGLYFVNLQFGNGNSKTIKLMLR